MTSRKEQIEKAAVEWQSSEGSLYHRYAFIAGAEFADANPELIAMLPNEPLMVENITIDQHYRFTQQIDKLQADLALAVEALEAADATLRVSGLPNYTTRQALEKIKGE